LVIFKIVMLHRREGRTPLRRDTKDINISWCTPPEMSEKQFTEPSLLKIFRRDEMSDILMDPFLENRSEL
jgi:hypothetical protein